MGNGASTIGDLFFPSNPDRRRRAEELKQQIVAYGNEFKELQASKDDALRRIRTKLDDLLRQRGFNSSQDLENKVRNIVGGEELRKYNALKGLLDLNEQAQSIMWDLIGIIGAGSGVILGGAVIIGAMTGGAALAAFGAIGEILAAVAVIIIVFGVIEGAIERDKLRDAINELWPKRAEIKQYLEQMRALHNWANAIEVWLNNPNTADHNIMDQLLTATLDREYHQWNVNHVCDVLLDMDRQNGAWTDEDPGRDSIHSSQAFIARTTASAAEATIPEKEIEAFLNDVPSFDSAAPVPKSRIMAMEATTAATPAHSGAGTTTGALVANQLHVVSENKTHEATIASKQILSKESCLVEDGQQTWKLTATGFDAGKVALRTTTFKLEPVDGHATIFEQSLAPALLSKVKNLDPGSKIGCSLQILATLQR